MVKEIPSLGELELLVLRLFWQEQPCSERRISDLVQERRTVARTTVLKTIQRLEAKGLLKRLPRTAPVQFRAAVDERRVLPELIGRFVDTALGGQPDALVAYLAGSGKLSGKDLAALKQIVRKMEKKTHPK